uniref:Uncharacterized protein n=1 Tax=Janibacter limosus TaxID=53458 RepID=A0AC61U296_9MICO|nr:hypothetical protein [Janibacter limosus]
MTTVVVARTGEDTGQVLSALLAQDRLPDRLLLVDGSLDGLGDTTALLAPVDEAGIDVLTSTLGPRRGIRRVLPAMIERLPRAPVGRDPVWVLTSRARPHPRALSRLVAASGRGVGMAAPKLVDESDPTLIVRFGLQVTRAGRIVPGPMAGTTDRGQHDADVDAIAAPLDGLPVDRGVYESLDGHDPTLGDFGGDLDTGVALAARRPSRRPRPRRPCRGASDQRGATSDRQPSPPGPPGRPHPRPRHDSPLPRPVDRHEQPAHRAGPRRAQAPRHGRRRAGQPPRGLRPAHPALAVARSCSARGLPRRPRRTLRPRAGRAQTADRRGPRVRRRRRWGRGALARGGARRRLAHPPAPVAAPAHQPAVRLVRTAHHRRAASGLRLRPWWVASCSAVRATAGQLWDSWWMGWRGRGWGGATEQSPALVVLALLAKVVEWVPGPGSAHSPAGLVLSLLVVTALPLAAAVAYVSSRTFTEHRWLRAAGALAWVTSVPAAMAVGEGRIGALCLLVLAPRLAAGLVRATRRSSRLSDVVRTALWGSLLATVAPFAGVAIIVVGPGPRARG